MSGALLAGEVGPCPSQSPRRCAWGVTRAGLLGRVCLLWETRLAPGREVTDTGQSSRAGTTCSPQPVWGKSWRKSWLSGGEGRRRRHARLSPPAAPPAHPAPMA